MPTSTISLRVADSGRRNASAGAVLRAVLEDGPIARSTIARITGLSPASVTGHCNELTELGLLRELPDQVRSNGAGRPHMPVDIDVTRHVVAAVHIAVRLTTVALLDLRGRVLARRQIPHETLTAVGTPVSTHASTEPAASVDVAARTFNAVGTYASTEPAAIVDVAARTLNAVSTYASTEPAAVVDVAARTFNAVGTYASTEPAAIVDIAARTIAELHAAHAGDGRLLGVGVATGGWVDPDAGVVMDHPRLGWSLVPLRDLLSARAGLPVYVDGHSRALLHAEVLFGEASRVGSVLHVFVGNVVDAAFATRGEAHYGSRAQAGAIAHLPVEGSREPCACGRIGCLEAAVSEQTLTRKAHERGIVDTPDIRTLFEAARDGNDAAVELFVDRSRQVGRAVALLMDVFGPEWVVVTDPTLPYLPRALDALRTVTRESVRTVCDIDNMLMPTSFPGRVLETAGGAVLLDALYRNPLGTINSEDWNVDIAGRFR